MKLKQQRMKLLRRSLSWLLLLGTLLTAVAGNTLPVSASGVVLPGVDKYRISFDASSKDPSKNDGSYYRNAAEFTSTNRLFFYLFSVTDGGAYNYRLGVLLDDGRCVNVNSLSDPVYVAMLYARTTRYNYSDNEEISNWVWDGSPGKQYMSYVSFSVYSAYDFGGCSGYIFTSLSTAYDYFDTGDRTGVLHYPPDLSDGDSSGDSSDTDDSWLQDLIDKLEELRDGTFGFFVEPFIAFGKGLLGIRDAILNLLPERIRDVVSSILEAQENLARDTFGKVNSIREFLESKAKDLFDFLKGIHDELINIGVKLLNLSWDLLPDGIKEKLQPWLDGLSGLLEKVRDGVDSMGQKLADMVPSFNDIRNAIKNSRIGEYVSDIKDDFSKLKELLTSFPAMSAAVSNFLEDPFYYIKKGVEKGFKDSFLGLLILPSDRFMKEFGENLKKDFSGIFAIVDEVKKLINWMANSSGAKAPKFTINLGESTSYNLGNTSVTIDFSWYDAYKPTVDLLFAAIIWAGFLWRMYSRIPEILNGMGMLVVMPYQIQHMEMEQDRRDLVRSRSDARWDVWERRNRR